jgi:NAD-dependent deacetylase
MGDTCEKGSQLRPHIVWFGEAVTKISEAAIICGKADIMVVIGTSLNVYPAAGLLDYAPQGIPIYLVDPNDVGTRNNSITFIKEKAGTGVQQLINILKKST